MEKDEKVKIIYLLPLHCFLALLLLLLMPEPVVDLQQQNYLMNSNNIVSRMYY
jgi:hypothetical protein